MRGPLRDSSADNEPIIIAEYLFNIHSRYFRITVRRLLNYTRRLGRQSNHKPITYLTTYPASGYFHNLHICYVMFHIDLIARVCHLKRTNVSCAFEQLR